MSNRIFLSRFSPYVLLCLALGGLCGTEFLLTGCYHDKNMVGWKVPDQADVHRDGGVMVRPEKGYSEVNFPREYAGRPITWELPSDQGGGVKVELNASANPSVLRVSQLEHESWVEVIGRYTTPEGKPDLVRQRIWVHRPD